MVFSLLIAPTNEIATLESAYDMHAKPGANHQPNVRLGIQQFQKKAHNFFKTLQKNPETVFARKNKGPNSMWMVNTMDIARLLGLILHQYQG
eukprot:1135152-Pyramimonas_sp.AAC.1